MRTDDGADPLRPGRLTAGLAAFAPTTAQAVLTLPHAHGAAGCPIDRRPA